MFITITGRKFITIAVRWLFTNNAYSNRTLAYFGLNALSRLVHLTVVAFLLMFFQWRTCPLELE